MRVANVNSRLSLLSDAGYLDVETASGGRFSPDPQRAFDDWASLRSWADSGPEGPLVADTSEVALGTPVPAPRQVLAIGLNYRDHATEAGLGVPEAPSVFTKFPTCVAGPHDRVLLPEGLVDWEVELVVALADRCDQVAEARCMVARGRGNGGPGISERQLQLAGPAPQFSLGKSFSGFGPTGPVLVTPDELADPDDMELGCRLEDGEVLQKGRTSDLIFSVAELIAHLSSVCLLLPGDLIFTGTPSGIGMVRTPPKFLGPGDVLVSWLEGVGTLRNPMAAPLAAAR